MDRPRDTACATTNLDAKTAVMIRLLDLVVSGMALLLLFPAFVLVGILIKATSPGPVYYRANRVGRNGQPIRLFKFRTMISNAALVGSAITVKHDPRITPVGRFLRRTKMDELPQLINVFQGEMSLVGPRPEAPRYVALYTPRQRQVLAVRPGITSRASLLYRDEESLLVGDGWEKTYLKQIMPHKLALDIEYLEQRTLWSDVALIAETVTAILRTGA